MNPRRGFIRRTSNGKRQAIVTFTDSDGRRHYRKATRDTLAEARTALDGMLEDIECGSTASYVPRTLHELLDWFKREHANPPQFRAGVKVSGYKSLTDVQQNIEILRRFLPNIPLRSVTYNTCAKLRANLLADKIVKGRNCKDEERLAAKVPVHRSIANVNRILSTFRTILNTATRSSFIGRKPFADGPPLISLALERQRMRILSWSEEAALLNACNTAPRILLFHAIVVAVESGMREGEMRLLEWSDVMLEKKLMRVRSENSKVNKERLVPITDRCQWSLLQLRKMLGGFGSVLSRMTNFTTSWKTACRLAKITGLRFHDLRHTFGSRAIAAGVQVGELSRIMGHSDVKMTMRYVNVDEETAQRVGEAVAALRLLRETAAADPLNSGSQGS